MKYTKFIFAFLFFAFTSNIVKAQKYDTIMLPLKYEPYVMVVGLNDSIPKKSRYLDNFTFEHAAISVNCDCYSVINKAKGQARNIGGNIIKITECIEPGFPNNCCKIKADILFNDSIKAAMPLMPKPYQLSYRLVKHKMQDTTTSYSRFKIMINPSLMFGQKEFGGLFEYYIKKGISLEFGGGINLKYNYLWEKEYIAGEGFTARAGMRLYSKSGFYFNPIIFYRQMKYHDRFYKWDKNGYSQQYEPGMMSCHCSGDSREIANVEIGNEDKQVFAFEALAGKEFRKGRMIIDLYAGLGVRYKYKKKEIVHSYSYEYSLMGETYYSPPKEENLYGYLPTIHVGVQIGFLSKAKK